MRKAIAESNQREPKAKSRSRDNRGRFSFSAPRPSSIRGAGCPASRQFPAGRCSSCCSSSGKCQQSEVLPILHIVFHLNVNNTLRFTGGAQALTVYATVTNRNIVPTVITIRVAAYSSNLLFILFELFARQGSFSIIDITLQ